MRKCFKCGSENILIMKRGGKAPITCEDCGAHNGFWGEPMSLDAALRFRMPIGKFKGISLLEIARLDTPYLNWARNNMENKNVVDAINLVIQHWVTKTKGQDNGN